MKRLLLAALVTLISSPERGPLEPKVQFLHGFRGGDPILVYYEITAPLELKAVRVQNLPIKQWRLITAFEKRNLEIEVVPEPGLNVEWDRLSIVDGRGAERTLYVAPSRAMYVPERARYEINYERMEQQPSAKLYMGLRIFNDSAQPVTVEKFVYAPSQVSANRIVIEPGYDTDWFKKLDAWANNQAATFPAGSSLRDSQNLNLTILPSKGFSAAVVNSSFKPGFSCVRTKQFRDPGKRVDSAYLQPLVQYRVGNSKSQFYPLPDAIITDLCP
jgi:hypothetical protein